MLAENFDCREHLFEPVNANRASSLEQRIEHFVVACGHAHAACQKLRGLKAFAAAQNNNRFAFSRFSDSREKFSRVANAFHVQNDNGGFLVLS